MADHIADAEPAEVAGTDDNGMGDFFDVADNENLAEFHAKLEEWRFWLEGDSDHAILQQIWAMLWNNAVFRVVDESRRVAGGAEAKYSSLNGSLGEFIDQGYFATQLQFVRRLLEPENTDPKKQIISLRRLLDDVERNSHLITREIYLSRSNLPFELEPAKARHFQKLRENTEKGVRASWGASTGPDAWANSVRKHRVFDRLSGALPETRSRDDLIKIEHFQTLRHILDDSGAKDLIAVANKLIAHAADESSRGVLGPRKGFSLEELDQCHRAITVVTNGVASTILQIGHVGSLPHPQFDWSEGLDRPWVEADKLGELHKAWDEYATKIDKICKEDAI